MISIRCNMILNKPCLFFLTILLRLSNGCEDWTPEQQAKEESLYISFGAGRLAARMTPYMMMLVFQEKHGFKVMVDRGIKDWIKK